MTFSRASLYAYRLRDYAGYVYRIIANEGSEATLTNFGTSGITQFRLSEYRIDEYFCRSKGILARDVSSIECYVRYFRWANNDVLVGHFDAKDF